ncbi:unnamed protein product [Dimorphilus gyrociliatus]|uniref:RING-type domain-containing protein n=1 Tax=Dimorphilus gyrociliatus TaxID=2664684 RepID=A0A7I8W9D6_9ANNE|nr:unnamed protein product [Dimorphilus gyrociliatus]
MASLESSVSVNSEQLVCSICLESWVHRTPRLLPCAHTFCHNCLEDLVKTVRNGKFDCPTCRKSTQFATVSEFPVNFYFSDLKDYQGIVRQNSVNTLCPIHNSSASLICETCNYAAVCRACTALHPGHELRGLQEFLETAKMDLYSKKLDFEKEKERLIVLARKELERRKEKLDNDYNDLCKQISHQTYNLIKPFDKLYERNFTLDDAKNLYDITMNYLSTKWHKWIDYEQNSCGIVEVKTREINWFVPSCMEKTGKEDEKDFSLSIPRQTSAINHQQGVSVKTILTSSTLTNSKILPSTEVDFVEKDNQLCISENNNFYNSPPIRQEEHQKSYLKQAKAETKSYKSQEVTCCCCTENIRNISATALGLFVHYKVGEHRFVHLHNPDNYNLLQEINFPYKSISYDENNKYLFALDTDDQILFCKCQSSTEEMIFTFWQSMNESWKSIISDQKSLLVLQNDEELYLFDVMYDQTAPELYGNQTAYDNFEKSSGVCFIDRRTLILADKKENCLHQILIGRDKTITKSKLDYPLIKPLSVAYSQRNREIIVGHGMLPKYKITIINHMNNSVVRDILLSYQPKRLAYFDDLQMLYVLGGDELHSYYL